MNRSTLVTLILLWLVIVWFTWWCVAQSKVIKAERIIEIDKQIAQLNEEIKLHQSWYRISINASEECSQSFIEDANKEHEEADKKRAVIKQLEEEKMGLIQNR